MDDDTLLQNEQRPLFASAGSKTIIESVIMLKQIIFVATLLVCLGLTNHARAISLTLNFTGECDDCAFSGNPGDADFDPLGDGLTQTVNATLTLSGLSQNTDETLSLGGGSAVFSYGGSSLINPFTMQDPFEFSPALTPSGLVKAGETFNLESSVNGSGGVFNFANFCTTLGNQVLGSGSCTGIGLVLFSLDSAGNWSVEGTQPFDVGAGGQFTPATPSAIPVPGALLLFSSGLIGLLGFTRMRNRSSTDS